MTRPYRQRSDETWAAARVAAICERFDLAERTVRQRQKDEGWRGRDLDDPVPAEPDPETDDLPPMGADDFADLAYHRMTVAARQGRVSVALACSRLRDATLRQVSLAEREADQREAAAVRHRRAANNESMDDVIRTARGI